MAGENGGDSKVQFMPGVDPAAVKAREDLMAQSQAFQAEAKLNAYRAHLAGLTSVLLSNFGPAVLALSDDSVDKAVDRAERILTTCNQRSPK